MMNLFRGQLAADHVFPFPDVLDDEQHEMLNMIVGPTEKFFEVFELYLYFISGLLKASNNSDSGELVLLFLAKHLHYEKYQPVVSN